jgi:hypothetical protein
MDSSHNHGGLCRSDILVLDATGMNVLGHKESVATGRFGGANFDAGFRCALIRYKALALRKDSQW